MIYLDNNATTPIADEVREAMLPYLTGEFGNPSSAHSASTNARQAIDEARTFVAELIGSASPEEVHFTSGGTESDNWAILGALKARPDKKHIITTRVEHEAVRNLCSHLEQNGYRVTWLDVDTTGALSTEQLKSEISDDTAVVSVMMANNETGILFPVEEIAQTVKSCSDALFHVDAVNAAGKVAFGARTTSIDLLSISAHKFHGPKGIGALYVRDGVKIAPLLTGGGQERGMRAGTEAVHQIVGMGAAAGIAAHISQMDIVKLLRDKLESGLLSLVRNSYLNGTNSTDLRLPNTSNISFGDTNGEMILHRLDELGICVSTGSACNSDLHTASPVLEAMDIPYRRSMGSIRFSLSRFNTIEEVDRVLNDLPPVVAGLRAMS
jgi:cysteine desulfurase